ncbi:hypothetical protein C8N30_0114 [Sulfitobacter guttiformis]|uniref:Uncharacterized protein n=1 Tax=Sulfitobacter guttiformis TaxID=74349 RepID=A0A420DN20_9RHOB|nr:hypothetical protein C8N30_0114 [Sulfitobacter guttiformis]
MISLATQNGASPTGGTKRHPDEVDWRCSCQGHALRIVREEAIE